MKKLSLLSLCLSIMIVSCISNSPARTQSQIKFSSDDLMYTFVSQDTASGNGELFDYSTAGARNTKRLALLTSSILLWKSDSTWVGSAPNSYVLNRVPGETAGETTYTLMSNGAQFCTGPADDQATSFSMPCSDGKIIFIRKISSLPAWSQGQPVKPSVSFNFWRVGPVYSGDSQSLAHVAPQRRISFSVSPALSSNPVFQSAFSIAADYWNRAAQREIIDTVVTPTTDFTFDMDRSLIKFHPQGNGAFLAKGKFLANPSNGTILRMTVDVFKVPGEKDLAGGKEFNWALIHELGHALGLAHNFAGSSDPLADKALGSTTVMDYFVPGKSIINPLPYDSQAMALIYSGVRPTEKFLLCSETQSWYKVGCDKFDDPLATSFEYWHKQLASPPDALAFAPLPALWESLYPSKFLKEMIEKAKGGDPEAYAIVASDIVLASGYKILKLINFSDLLTQEQIAELKRLEQEQINRAIEFKIWSPEQQAALEFLRDQFVNPIVTKNSFVKFINSKSYDEEAVISGPAAFIPSFRGF
jgi:hypothetical protein